MSLVLASLAERMITAWIALTASFRLKSAAAHRGSADVTVTQSGTRIRSLPNSELGS